MPTTSATFHTVFNVQSTRYFEWQSRYFMFWAKVAPRFAARSWLVDSALLTRTPLQQQAQQPGEVTRLLSANNGDHLMDTVKTHVAPPWDMVRLRCPGEAPSARVAHARAPRRARTRICRTTSR
jgi:hypothetical protein